MDITCSIPNDLIPIGTKVFLPRPAIQAVLEDCILGYSGILERSSDGQYKLSPSDYRLNTVNVERGGDEFDCSWKSEEFFLSYEAAMAMAKEYKIILSDEEWYKLIGFKTSEQGHHFETEDCDLAPCCGAIERIREMLGKVAWSKHISAVNRSILAKMLANHDAPEAKPRINSLILKQIDLIW